MSTDGSPHMAPFKFAHKIYFRTKERGLCCLKRWVGDTGNSWSSKGDNSNFNLALDDFQNVDAPSQLKQCSIHSNYLEQATTTEIKPENWTSNDNGTLESYSNKGRQRG